MQKNNYLNLESHNDEVEIFQKENEYIFRYTNNSKAGDFRGFKSRNNIKFGGEKDFENRPGSIEISFMKKGYNDDLIIEIYNYHLKLMNEDKNITNYRDALEVAISYFDSQYYKFRKSQLYGDIGEIVFIIKSQEKKYNVKNCIRSDDTSLYDFKINNTYIDIKCTSLDKNRIIISNNQVDYVDNRKFIVVSTKFIQDGDTLLDLYNKVNPLPHLLEAKKQNWSSEDNKEFVKANAINLEKTEIGVLKDRAIPKFQIDKHAALDKFLFYINTKNELDDFENIMNIICKEST